MKHFLLLSIIFYSFSTFAQEFSFPIYFEDALGNKDTIVIGYDATATNGIDPQFGEVDIINQPWQGPLDVRVGTIQYNHHDISPIAQGEFLSKIVIQPLSCDVSSFPINHSIEFHTDNYPLKMKWNKNILNDSCVKSTFIIGHQPSPYGYSLYFLNDSLEINYLQTQDTYFTTDTFKIKHYSSTDPIFLIPNYKSLDKKIGVINFKLKPVNLVYKQELSIEPFNIFPNPTTDKFHIETEAEITHLEIFDALGKSVLQQTGNNKTVQIEHLEVGMYTLKIDTQLGVKFVKINKM